MVKKCELTKKIIQTTIYSSERIKACLSMKNVRISSNWLHTPNLNQSFRYHSAMSWIFSRSDEHYVKKALVYLLRDCESHCFQE